MAIDWTTWIHAIITTYGSWLPGDPRGFRDHDHRIHSSGNYKAPPPTDEHAGLYRFAEASTKTAVFLAHDVRDRVATALAEKLQSQHVKVRCIAVAGTHAHILACVGSQDAKPIIGRAKQAASHRVRDRLPGTVWAQGCHVVRVRDEAHYRSVVNYIARHAEDGACVWNHPDLRKASGPASSNSTY